MPRIALDEATKIQYMTDDFSAWVVGKMKKQGLTQTDIADVMGITQQGFAYKVKHNAFDLMEIIFLFKHLNARDDEILRLMKM